MMLKRVHSLAVSPLRLFFVWTCDIPFFRGCGFLLYRFGLSSSIRLFRTLKGLTSVYAMSDMSGDFEPGRSDIDFALVAADMAYDGRIRFMKRYNVFRLMVRIIFPFISHPRLFFRREFEDYQRLRHREIFQKNKHFRHWMLLWGEDTRLVFEDAETEPSAYALRDAYENLLLNIYDCELNHDEDYRRLYKSAVNIVRSAFLSSGGRDADGVSGYREFMISRGMGETLADSLFSMPARRYRFPKDDLPILLYHLMRLFPEGEVVDGAASGSATKRSQSAPPQGADGGVTRFTRIAACVAQKSCGFLARATARQSPRERRGGLLRSPEAGGFTAERSSGVCQRPGPLQHSRQSPPLFTNETPGELVPFVDSLEKRGLKSAHLSKIPFKEGSSYLYLVVDTSSPEDFCRFFRSLTRNLRLIGSLRREAALRVHNRFLQDFKVFPLVLSDGMSLGGCFFDGFLPCESLAFNFWCVKLYGADMPLGEDIKKVQRSFKVFLHAFVLASLPNLAFAPWPLKQVGRLREPLDYAMAYRLISAKGNAVLSNVKDEYMKAFGQGFDLEKTGEVYDFITRTAKSDG